MKNQKLIMTPINILILIVTFVTTACSVSGWELQVHLAVISFLDQIIFFIFFLIVLTIVSLASVYSVILIRNVVLDLYEAHKKLPILNKIGWGSSYSIGVSLVLKLLTFLFFSLFFLILYYYILIVLLPYLIILFVKLNTIFFAFLYIFRDLCITIVLDDEVNKFLTANLVVWGTNLSSNVGKPRFSRLVSNLVQLPPHVKSLFYGLLLSDGWLAFSAKSINARFGFNQSLAHFEYCWHVFCLLAHYCISYPSFKTGKRLGTITFALEFCTRSLACITELYSLWYKDGIKVIPEDIFHYLTPIALAHWIMGDGAVQKFGLILCTDKFSVEDVVRLNSVLMIKYQIIGNVVENRPGQYRIYISEKSMPLLRSIVLPHFVPSMLYKIKA